MLRATTRLQLHAGFTLDDACEQVPYYASLGISHLYTSPVSRARPGSMHGYDVIDHSMVNPELGGLEALESLVARLRQHDMGLVLDIVPNHMAVHPGNAWWWDVLEHGEQSRYASWLDIDWHPGDATLDGKVLAPFLAEPYGHTLIGGGIRLVFDAVSQSHRLDINGVPYPIAPGTLCTAETGPQALVDLYDSSQTQGQQRLHELLERQHYRLAWWRCAPDSINWRRFFEISELMGVRVEKQEVFDAVHALPLRLYEQGLIDGLRIDHVDGLADPIAYCRQLRRALEQRVAARPGPLSEDQPWLVVEKILAEGEVLDDRWEVDGTSGYDFMDQAAAVLHDPAGEPLLTEHWTSIAQDGRPLRDVVHDARRLMLRRHFVAERKGLLRALSGLAQASVYTRDWTTDAIARTLDEVLVAFPVYRNYSQTGRRNQADAECLARTMRAVSAGLGPASDVEQSLLEVLDMWLGASPLVSAEGANTDIQQLQREAIRRFQQLTPPLAAKSLEDTTFYRYGRLISRNEVGSDPSVLGISSETFHQRNIERAGNLSRSLLATATHDHKRGEDVRARLAVLSEMPGQWAQISNKWLEEAQKIDPAANSVQVAERYMLFQTLVGAWPLGLAANDGEGLRLFADRVVEWHIKSLREAKLNSGWFEPDTSYEERSANFIHNLMAGRSSLPLIQDIEQFVDRIAPAGAVNSLSQTVLRLCSPGVPDLYQGTEFWDFSLVDPDNRREVDYAARRHALGMLGADTGIAALIKDWKNGWVKQAVVAALLRLRRERADQFSKGDYFGLPVLGSQSNRVLAFLRAAPEKDMFVVVPRLSSAWVGLGANEGLPLIDTASWEDTCVVLPRRYIGVTLRDVFSGTRLECSQDGVLRLADLLADQPLTVLLPAQG
ncbi:malto-oligosyltrehalose synthase [Pollutimonas nitritireducens]|uniref:Malto-oligosyltrehalose synthase n=1 Tax=Pollutimonas nitritireducens TaxID=2045209 RepID=A0A2N4UHN3_9BURK|nr:malto-oligosyltrehalose synthase [Pollutimonas nitritireducens]PLC54536.1 malto-oligosyltrehalose synthase [Pollutimonas nitritireducens]